MPTPIGEIAGAIKEGFKLLGQYLSGSKTRRMGKAIEFGERIARRYYQIIPKENRDKRIVSYIEAFFKVNN